MYREAFSAGSLVKPDKRYATGERQCGWANITHGRSTTVKSYLHSEDYIEVVG